MPSCRSKENLRAFFFEISGIFSDVGVSDDIQGVLCPFSQDLGGLNVAQASLI